MQAHIIHIFTAALAFNICIAAETPLSLIDLKLQQVAISARYREAHPMAQEILAKIEAYRKIHPEKTIESDLDLACRRYTELKVEQALLSSRYRPKHPSRAGLERKIEFLESLPDVRYEEAHLYTLLKEKEATRDELTLRYQPSHRNLTEINASISFIQTTLKKIANKTGDNNSE